MKLNKEGLACSIAYWYWDTTPSRVSVFAFPFQFLFGIAVMIVFVTIFIVFLIASYLIGFFFAQRPPIFYLFGKSTSQAYQYDDWWYDTRNKSLTVPYKHWPKVYKRRIYPIWLLIAWVTLFDETLPLAFHTITTNPLYTLYVGIVSFIIIFLVIWNTDAIKNARMRFYEKLKAWSPQIEIED